MHARAGLEAGPLHNNLGCHLKQGRMLEVLGSGCEGLEFRAGLSFSTLGLGRGFMV